MLFIELTTLSSFTNANSLSSISMNNQECKTRPQFVNVNGDERVFFLFSIKTSKCNDSFNNINYSYAKICVLNVVKDLNVRIFNLMSRTNETKHIEWHETSKCECKFGANVCNNKQLWDKYKFRCEWKELIDKVVCEKGFIWNPSNCEWECNKACDVGEYVDYNNCKCRKKLVAPIVDECTETVEEVKLAKVTLAENENSHKCTSCTVYIVLMIVVFTICAGISACFVYYKWSRTQTTILKTFKW